MTETKKMLTVKVVCLEVLHDPSNFLPSLKKHPVEWKVWQSVQKQKEIFLHFSTFHDPLILKNPKKNFCHFIVRISRPKIFIQGLPSFNVGASHSYRGPQMKQLLPLLLFCFGLNF